MKPIFRSGSWSLHKSAIRRSIPLMFAFNHTNYSRWTPLYLEDCLKLETDFPAIYQSFEKGGFVVQRSIRKNSSIPMDQALEVAYNKLAKSSGGIIGITRRKAAVAQWNLIHQEKAAYKEYLELKSRPDSDYSQFSLHREFTKAAASSALDKRERVINQLKRFGNLFSQVNDGKPILNMATGQNHELLFKSKLNCLKVGETMYLSFKEERFDNKTLSIFDKLSRTTNITAADEEKNRQKLNMNVAKECQSVQQYISYAELRGFDLRELFKYELSSVPLFLFKNDGSFQKNDQKSQLVNEIFKLFQGN